MPSHRFPASWYPADNDVTYTSPPVIDAPYTATIVTTFHYLDEKTGKVMSVSRSTLKARDRMGRTRDEVANPRPDGRGGVIMTREVSVSDPVSHCSFRWLEPATLSEKPTAAVTCMPRTVHYNGSQNIYANIVVEPAEVRSGETLDESQQLGERKFGQVEAVGVRHTKTTIDPQTGTTLRSVTEIWYAPMLKELMELKVIPDSETNAATGSTPDFELTGLKVGEPDASLFYPPTDFEIKPE